MKDMRALEIDSFLAQGETLTHLIQHPSWPTYIGLLREMRQSALEELVIADPASIRYWQGVASTLLEIIDRPDRIIASASNYQRTEEADRGVVRTELRAAMGIGIDLEGDF